MSSLFKQYATNRDAETNGVPVTFAPNDDGTVPTFYVARMSKANSAYVNALEKKSRPYRRQIELETLSNAKAEQIQRDVFVETVLKGWDNVQNEDGSNLAFNVQNALMLFERLQDLYEELQQQAKKLSNFQVEARELEAKN